MTISIMKAILAAFLIAACVPTLAAAASRGSAKEEAACRPDVRRFCSSIKSGSDNQAFLACLQAHRTKLSKACLAVLTSHGS